MRISLACMMLLVAIGSQATIDITWDNATPLANQTIDGTEIRVDASPVGTTTADTYAIDDTDWAPGDYDITVRHFGTVDGAPAVSPDSNTLVYTIAGAPGVAPVLRFRPLDRAA